MTDDPYSFANRALGLEFDPEQATEVNQPMYAQTQSPGQIDGGYHLGTGGMLGAPYGQNPEHPSLHQPGAPTPTQGLLAPVYPTLAYPSSSQRHAPVGTLNHTGNFGASNVGASNLNDGHAGHFLPPTSTQFNGHGVDANPAPLQTSSHAVMPPSATSTPPMTAGTSRSSSHTPETPSSVNVWNPPTTEDLIMLMVHNLLLQLTSEQLRYFWRRFEEGNPLPPWELSAMVAANRANETSSSAHHAGPEPPVQPIPAYGPSSNGAPRSRANGTPGAYRTPQTREHRYDPLSATTTTTTTCQAAATGADLEHNDNKSTGATIMGGAYSSGAGGVASSRSRSAKAAADESTLPGAISTPSTSPRYGTEWSSPRKLLPETHAALNRMYLDMDDERLTDEERNACNRRCLVPNCRYPVLKTHQKRNLHVSRVHLKAEKTFVCEEAGCSSVVVGWDSRLRHVKVEHPDKVEEVKMAWKAEKAKLTKKLSKTKSASKAKSAVDEEEDGEGAGPSEMVTMYKAPRKDDDDDTGFGDIGGMFTAGSYGCLQA